MGFQECEDEHWLLEKSGLSAEYSIFRDRACCMAFKNAMWHLLERGVHFVAADVQYGQRPLQWMRLRHRHTGAKVFFANHHGPIPVNGGGVCGPSATAHSIVQTIARVALPGDAIVLVGDFNAVPESLELVRVESRLHRTFGGTRGRIDSVFANLDDASVIRTTNLGAGGSDHDALSVVFRLGAGPLISTSTSTSAAPTTTSTSTSAAPTTSTTRATSARAVAAPKASKVKLNVRCGAAELNVHYDFPEGSFRLHWDGVEDPEACCSRCRHLAMCKSWTWAKQGRCWLWSGSPSKKSVQEGSVSGLPAPGNEAAATTTSALRFNCEAGLEWVAMWSSAKREWCCQHDQKGCHPVVAKARDPGATRNTSAVVRQRRRQ
mmetsp:Transcript_14344/g.32618  ORF Transcript_14344/g.32618 Transcript_14344/m.32618 type:complete len:377 (+) Transcript_14344:1-1131(+)